MANCFLARPRSVRDSVMSLSVAIFARTLASPVSSEERFSAFEALTSAMTPSPAARTARKSAAVRP